MNKTGKIFLVTGTALLLVGAVNVAKAANTAENITMVLDSFSLRSKKLNGLGLTVKIPKIIFEAALTVHNPTGDDLVISKPYLKVFYNDNPNPIGFSSASAKTYVLKAKQPTPLTVDIEFSADNVLPVMPDFLKYILDRIKGKKANRKVVIEMLASGNGINSTSRKEVMI